MVIQTDRNVTYTRKLFIVISLALLLLLSGCQSMENINLTRDCKDALRANQNIDHTKLVCNVKEGVAYVAGTVYTELERDLVEETLMGVEGITDVRATITIEVGGERNPVMLGF